MPATVADLKGGPLNGLQVVEVGQYISAPYAGKLLADLGADVVKIESPDGDPMRRWEGNGQEHNPQFAVYNRSKSSVVLDLKSEEGLADLQLLVAGADVLIENFRPGVADRLGFGVDVMCTRNPRLVYCSVTGFGPRGPYARRPAYDTVISAVGGMYSQITEPDAARPIGPAFSDLLAGTSAVQAILAALHARNRSGRGQHVEISMVGSLLDFLAEAAGSFLQTGTSPGPDTRARRAQAYVCVGSDGLAFVVHMSVPEKFWLGLLEVLDRRELADDPRFSTRESRVTNYEALDTELKAATRRRPRSFWMQQLAERDIPHGPLNQLSELFDDPQMQALDLLTAMPDQDGNLVPTVRHSTVFHGSGRPEYRAAPRLGEHNDSLVGVGIGVNR